MHRLFLRRVDIAKAFSTRELILAAKTRSQAE